MPLWGRPPGASIVDGNGSGNGSGRRRRRAWESRKRFRNSDYSDEEDDSQGVMLDSANLSSPSPANEQISFAGDELYFTGYDIGGGRGNAESQLNNDDYGEEYGYSDDEERHEYERQYAAYQAAMHDRELALVRSAQESIRRAKARGKTNVNLSQDEVDALERRRLQQRHQLAPAIAARDRSSRSSSIVGSGIEKTRKKTNRLFSAPSPNTSKSRTLKARKPSVDQNFTTAGAAALDFMTQGPNGQPVYAPVGYYAGLPETTRHLPNTRGSPRSASASSKRQDTPLYNPGYSAYRASYLPPRTDSRPPSASSSRAPADGLHVPRNRAATSAPYPQDLSSPAPLPAAHARRNFSGPPDISYTKLRRVPQSSPLAPRPAPTATHSDPSLPSRRTSRPEHDDRDSSGTDDDDSHEGVSVEIVPEQRSRDGYRIDRVPIGGRGGEKRRKDKR